VLSRRPEDILFRNIETTEFGMLTTQMTIQLIVEPDQ